MITSLGNEKIKEIRKLKERKFRSATGMFFIEGIRIVIEAIEENARIGRILFAPQLARTDIVRSTIEMARKKNIEVLEVSEQVFLSISKKDGPQGIGAIVQQNVKELSNIGKQFIGIWVALFEVADPGNLGTIIRSLDAAGGNGIFLIDDCCDPYDPGCLRASMGAIFSIEIIKISKQEFIDWTSKNKVNVIGTSDSANFDYRKNEYEIPLVLLMGSEREGLPEELKRICRNIVRIPMRGKSDSLNLAIATSIMLYEIIRKSDE